VTRPFSLLGACHLGVLATIAGYLALLYPDSRQALALLFAAALTSEAMPARARRWLAGEIVLLICGAATWYGLVRTHPLMLDGWLRMLVAYWLLIPSRLGLLRWTVSLVAAEALWLGTARLSFPDWRPLHGVALAWPLVALLPIALSSLALDAWLQARLRARGRTTLAALAAWRWALAPTAVLAGVLLLLAPLIPHRLQVAPKLVTGRARSGLSAPTVAPGEARWIVRDPTPRLRLLWDDPEHPLFEGSAYVRLYTLPHLRLDGPLLRWEAEPPDRLRVVANRFDPSARLAWMLRMPLGNDAVIAADLGGGVELDDLLGDRHGNRYQSGFDESTRAYRINLDPPHEPDDADDPVYRELPAEVSSLPWDTLEDAAWRKLDAVAAGDAVTRSVRGLCTYDIENLPTPEARPAGMLTTFLWGELKDRRGHCQHFATAVAVILRHLGFATRVCAGFVSDELTTDGYTFRGLHAHAWLEVRDAHGFWQRVDPTPPGYLDIRGERGPEADPSDDATPAHVPDATTVQRLRAAARGASPTASTHAHRTWLAGMAIGGVLLAAAIAYWRRRATHTPLDPRLADLRARADHLERLAAELGVIVAPHHTLSDLVRQLSARTGIDLDHHLRSHLAARYGRAPLPEPWPIADLRRAARARSGRQPNAAAIS
jgi:transglutaminase-like putative cysteine protease